MQTFTIAEWCEMRKISRAYFYVLAKRGEAPKTIRFGARSVRITAEADAAWLAAREAASGEVAA